MKHLISRNAFRVLRGLLLTAGLVGGTFERSVQAYPPAPFHLFFGMLRDEYGEPILSSKAEVILESPGGVEIKTTINPGIEAESNYRLEVPMDAGLMSGPYQPTALRPFASFRVKVRIGRNVYLPIEMRGDYGSLGQPGKRTRINLTLGEDANGDGLPDAWQRLINADLSKVRPDADAGNGLTYLETYLAGTYAVDPSGGFELKILDVTNSVPQLAFVAVTGRTYRLLSSLDLVTWTPTEFRIPADGLNAPVRSSFVTYSVKAMQIEPVVAEGETTPTLFRLVVQ